MTLLIHIIAWCGIAYGLCWLTIATKRAVQTAWSELLNGAARGMR